MENKLLKNVFGLSSSQHKISKEIIAGLSTFLTMAYILSVNPMILSATGMDKEALFTTTAVASFIATFLMAVYAKLPFVLAPGMGLNAFFAFTVCGALGYSWQFALTAVLVEGIIVIILSLTGIREKIVHLLPKVLRDSIGIGIGLYIAFIGLQKAEIIINNDATLVGLGNLSSPSILLACIGIIITGILLIRKITGALLLGIIITTIIGIPMGITHIESIFSMPPSIEPIFCKFELDKILSTDMLIVLSTFLFVDLFGTMGTLIGVANQANMIREDGTMHHMNRAFLVDAIGTTAGSILGTSTVTTFIESATGISAGGRTGLTAFTSAMCFLVALFFAPLFLAIPTAATAPVLFIVGLMMISSITEIDIKDYSVSLPAFVCIIMTPLTYSIADGIILGMLSYILINLFTSRRKEITWATILLGLVFALKYII